MPTNHARSADTASEEGPTDALARRQVIRAQRVLAGSAVLFGLMAFAAKLASERLGGSQVALVRFAIGALPMLLAPRYHRLARSIERWDLLFYRGILGGAAVLLYFLALEHIAMGTAALLNCTSPIFAVALARIFLGERVRQRVLLPAALAMTGVILVIGGHARLGDQASHDGESTVYHVNFWALAALGSAVLAGAALVAVRAARKTESSWAIFASFSVMGVIVTAPLGLGRWVSPTWNEWIYLLTVGITSLIAQLGMTWAFRWLDNLRAGVIGQISVVVSMLLSVFALGDRLTLLQLVGSIFTMVGVVGVVARGAPAVPSPSGTRRGPLPADTMLSSR